MPTEPGPRDRRPGDNDLPGAEEALDSVKKSIDEQVASISKNVTGDDLLFERLAKLVPDRSTREYFRGRWIEMFNSFKFQAMLYNYLHYVSKIGVPLGLLLILMFPFLAYSIDEPSFYCRHAPEMLAGIGLLCYSLAGLLNVDERRLLYRAAVQRLRKEGWDYIQRSGQYESRPYRASIFMKRSEFVIQIVERMSYENLAMLDDLESKGEVPVSNMPQ